jgi:hypothetical protein
MMQGFSAGRRPKPKVVKSTIEDEDEDIENVSPATESREIEASNIPEIRRLNRPASSKKSSGSKLKLSFGANDVCSFFFQSILMQKKDSGDEEAFVLKRSSLSKKVTESKGRKFGLQVYVPPPPSAVDSNHFTGMHCRLHPQKHQIYPLDQLTQKNTFHNSEIPPPQPQEM